MENSLKSGANKRRLGEKLWLVFVLANAVLFLVAVCISVFWPSELPKFVSSLTIVSGLALIYAYLIEWCLDALVSKQSKSALEILERDNDKLREENNELQKELASVRAELEETRGRLYEADVQFEKSLGELVSARAELRKVKLELLHAKEEANLAKLHYESLRKAYSEATLDLLKIRSELKDTRSKLDLTNRILCDEIVAADNALYDAEALQSERDDLQSKLATARRFVRRLLAERNKLRYELTKARIGFGFFRREYVDAEARVAYAQQQIKDLESAVEARDDVIGSLLDDVVIRTKG